MLAVIERVLENKIAIDYNSTVIGIGQDRTLFIRFCIGPRARAFLTFNYTIADY